MEALGSPSISRAPMGGGGGHAFRKLVYAGNKHNDIHYRSLPETHFTGSGFFLRTFDRLCVFVFVSLWSFFANLHIMKSRKTKQNKKRTKTKKPKKKNPKKQQFTWFTNRSNTLLCRSFSDYHVIAPPAIGILGVICCFIAIVGTAGVSIVSAKLRNAYYFSG